MAAGVLDCRLPSKPFQKVAGGERERERQRERARERRGGERGRESARERERARESERERERARASERESERARESERDRVEGVNYTLHPAHCAVSRHGGRDRGGSKESQSVGNPGEITAGKSVEERENTSPTVLTADAYAYVDNHPSTLGH